ncbi:MAG: hypothetical protein N4A49_02040 [Marinifilaceae bacterium]|jgi:hypothetical protein|nr:hypothetical protein [Marinifilaceae bacterium]
MDRRSFLLYNAAFTLSKILEESFPPNKIKIEPTDKIQQVFIDHNDFNFQLITYDLEYVEIKIKLGLDEISYDHDFNEVLKSIEKSRNKLNYFPRLEESDNFFITRSKATYETEDDLKTNIDNIKNKIEEIIKFSQSEEIQEIISKYKQW